jgi:hypothetical protein
LRNESDFPCLSSQDLSVSGFDELSTCRDCKAVRAVQHLKPMRGGCQSKLMLGADSQAWVVKFRNNPQHKRILANEHIAGGLARMIGLSVPPATVVCVGQELLDISPDLSIQGPRGERTGCATGPQFASRYAGGLMPSFVLDCLPDEALQQTVNLSEFIGVLAFDKWTGNTDDRQAVFVRTLKRTSYKAYFIDFGHCFNGGSWTFPNSPLAGLYGKKLVYAGVSGWNSFEPWLSRIENVSIDSLWQLAIEMPADWYDRDINSLERLILALDKRKGSIRQLIHEYRISDALPFPGWRPRNSSRWSKPPITSSIVQGFISTNESLGV